MSRDGADMEKSRTLEREAQEQGLHRIMHSILIGIGIGHLNFH